MAASGGNKKTSSQSDKNYWQRAKASNYSETHKAKRVNRHASRLMRQEKISDTKSNREMTIKRIGHQIPSFPKRGEKRVLTRVVLTEQIGEGQLRMHKGYEGKDGTVYPGSPLFQGYVAGVLVESSFNHSAVIAAVNESSLETHQYKQHPSGRRELIAFRPAR